MKVSLREIYNGETHRGRLCEDSRERCGQKPKKAWSYQKLEEARNKAFNETTVHSGLQN